MASEVSVVVVVFGEYVCVSVVVDVDEDEDSDGLVGSDVVGLVCVDGAVDMLSVFVLISLKLVLVSVLVVSVAFVLVIELVVLLVLDDWSDVSMLVVCEAVYDWLSVLIMDVL